MNSFDPKKPKISIVIPSYNQAKFIAEALESIKKQSYKNYEIIIVDGGSTDDTLKIISNDYSDLITILISEPDLGQSDALNKGYALATGDIMGWMNSDDIYVEESFQNTIKAFNDNPNALVVFGDWVEVDEEGDLIRREYAFDFSLTQTIYEGAQLNVQSMFWRSVVQHEFSGFDINLHTTMDYQFLLEIGLKYNKEQFLRLPTVLGGYRRYLGQKTDGTQYNAYRDEHILIARNYSINNKLNFIGYFIKIILKVRRLYWYFKRGGLKYTFDRIYLSKNFLRKDFL